MYCIIAIMPFSVELHVFIVNRRHFDVCLFVLEVKVIVFWKCSKLWNWRNFLRLSESFCADVVASYASRQETLWGGDNLMNGFNIFIKDESLLFH